MNISKKISWPAAAIAAATLVASTAAHADNRGHGRNGHGYDHSRDRNGDYRGWERDHRRVWRDHEHRYYAYRDQRHPRYRYPAVRYHDYRPIHYYGYRDYGWPVTDFGASLTVSIPLR